MGRPILKAVTTWMSRGSQTEAEAVAYYESLRDLDTTKIGFVTNDTGTIGASPDRLVGEDGILEIKVPKESTHTRYLLSGAVGDEYWPQIQGQLWVTERKWVDIMSYSPGMPEACIRVVRDEDYIRKLATAVTAFAGELDRVSRDAKARGWIREEVCR